MEGSNLNRGVITLQKNEMKIPGRQNEKRNENSSPFANEKIPECKVLRKTKDNGELLVIFYRKWLDGKVLEIVDYFSAAEAVVEEKEEGTESLQEKELNERKYRVELALRQLLPFGGLR